VHLRKTILRSFELDYKTYFSVFSVIFSFSNTDIGFGFGFPKNRGFGSTFDYRKKFVLLPHQFLTEYMTTFLFISEK